MTTIKLRRINAMADWLRSYQIVIDDEVSGKIKNGQEVELEVPPGKHRLQLRIDWCDSNPIEFELIDESLTFECGSNFRGLRLLKGVGNILGQSGHYLYLRRDSV